jgi:hypothetical protein
LGRGQVACQCLLELSRLGLEFPLGQRHEWLGILFTVGECLQHACARQAQHAGGDLATRDMCRFEEVLEPVGDRRPIAPQELPVTRQCSPFAAVPGWHAAGLEQTMAPHITNPITVPDVSLPSQNRFAVVGIDQYDGQAVFQQIEDRPLVDARALHGHVRATGRQEPISQWQESRRHGREGPHLLRACDAETSHDRVDMPSETAAARRQDFHVMAPVHVLSMRTTRQESLRRAH